VLDEQIALLRGLGSEPVIDFTGSFHRIDRAGILPLPPSPIPIWMGGFGNLPTERAARSGDGYIFGGNAKGPELARQLLEKLRQNGRDLSTFAMDASVSFAEETASWHASLKTWSELGARYISLRTMGPPGLHNPGPRLASPREHIAALETFMNVARQYRRSP
jgi:alkanesulfonate monooxygenase SsuD/methylene tetrahydromethanopterin reductase-like flavin-dependent oxidoreductase (luciferase family)